MKYCTKIYDNGFVIRKHNTRIICLKKDDGWEIYTNRFFKHEDMEYPPSVKIKRNILGSRNKFSEETLQQIVTGIGLFNKRNSDFLNRVFENVEGETIIVETTFTIKK